MQKILIGLCGILLFSCSQNKGNSSWTQDKTVVLNYESEKSKNFDWLLGQWKQIDEDAEHETFENWTKESVSRYSGHGFVLEGEDTIWQEKMLLSFSDSLWTLKVMTPGNNDLVVFSLTEFYTDSFIVENTEHDFPKKIKYWKHGNHLHAVVSGDEHIISFEFEGLEG